MKRFPAVLALLLLAASPLLAGNTDIPRLIDHDGPAEGVVPLDLEELWRVGGEDGDVLFGRITDVERHPDGTIYVLDNQLCHVSVFSAEGEHLGDLSREGEGPGELRQPSGMILMPGDEIGVGLGFPGKLVVLKRDGTPLRTLYPVGEPADGNIALMMGLDGAGEHVVACGGSMAFGGLTEPHTARFLAVTDPAGASVVRVAERDLPLDMTGRHWVETDNYYPDERWAVAADGRIYGAFERDAFEITALDPAGTPLFVFGRPCDPRRRDEAELESIHPIIDMGTPRENRDWEVSDHDPCISRVMIDPEDGCVWVLGAREREEPPEGILHTWDVFSPEGEYLRRVPIPLGHAMRQGECQLVGGGRLVMVRGAGSAHRADQADSVEDPEPLEVICYARR